MTTITTASGRTKVLPPNVDAAQVAGLDEAGRIVMDWFDARNTKPTPIGGGYSTQPFMFGLTLCCNADKGGEDDIYCRACYGTKPNADAGSYLDRAADGSFPGLDPIA
jgi:hypothetical protein